MAHRVSIYPTEVPGAPIACGPCKYGVNVVSVATCSPECSKKQKQKRYACLYCWEDMRHGVNIVAIVIAAIITAFIVWWSNKHYTNDYLVAHICCTTTGVVMFSTVGILLFAGDHCFGKPYKRSYKSFVHTYFMLIAFVFVFSGVIIYTVRPEAIKTEPPKGKQPAPSKQPGRGKRELIFELRNPPPKETNITTAPGKQPGKGKRELIIRKKRQKKTTTTPKPTTTPEPKSILSMYSMHAWTGFVGLGLMFLACSLGACAIFRWSECVRPLFCRCVHILSGLLALIFCMTSFCLALEGEWFTNNSTSKMWATLLAMSCILLIYTLIAAFLTMCYYLMWV